MKDAVALGGKNILYIDDRIPHKVLGSGFPRANAIVHELVNLGYVVTLLALTDSVKESNAEAYADLPENVNIVPGVGLAGFYRFWSGNRNLTDILWVSRPNNMAFVKLFLKGWNGKLVYDAEAFFSLRRESMLKAEGISDNTGRMLLERKREAVLGCKADCIVAVSEGEADIFREHGLGKTFVLGHSVAFRPTNQSFHSRKNLLFVGNLDHHPSPNTDSIIWFVNEVLPLLADEIGIEVIGASGAREVQTLASGRVRIHGVLNDIREYYENCRVFVAPTRYAAGIPLKLIEAAGNGIPIVATSLLGSQLAWASSAIKTAEVNDAVGFAGSCAAVYDDSKLWNQLRENALAEVTSRYSSDLFRSQIEVVLSSLH